MADILSQAISGGLRWGRKDGSLVVRADLIAEARSWIGTPFIHQHEMKGHGVDCGGLIRGASVSLGLIPRGYRHQIPPSVRAYARQPDGTTAKLLCDHYWQPISINDARAGDVVLIQYRAYPQHTALLADYRHGGLSMIHAIPNHGVVEHHLDDTWRRRIVAAYSIPGVQP